MTFKRSISGSMNCCRSSEVATSFPGRIPRKLGKRIEMRRTRRLLGRVHNVTTYLSQCIKLHSSFTWIANSDYTMKCIHCATLCTLCWYACRTFMPMVYGQGLSLPACVCVAVNVAQRESKTYEQTTRLAFSYQKSMALWHSSLLNIT